MATCAVINNPQNSNDPNDLNTSTSTARACPTMSLMNARKPLARPNIIWAMRAIRFISVTFVIRVIRTIRFRSGGLVKGLFGHGHFTSYSRRILTRNTQVLLLTQEISVVALDLRAFVAA